MKTPLIAALLFAATLSQATSLSDALTAYDAGNLKAAAQRFAESARRGEALGQFNLAMMNLRRELPGASDAKAWALLQRAAAQQHALAENALGEMIEQGRRGKPDAKAACGWRAGCAKRPCAAMTAGSEYSPSSASSPSCRARNQAWWNDAPLTRTPYGANGWKNFPPGRFQSSNSMPSLKVA